MMEKEVVAASGGSNSDDYVLSQQGKVAVHHRRFGFWSLLGLCCTSLVSWQAVFFINTTPLLEGGPVGFLYGYILAWIGGLATAASLGELASVAPVSSGQYFWTSILAPPSHRKFLTWLTGWMTVIGWLAVLPSAAQLTASIVQTLAQINHPSTYEPKMWHLTLIMWAIAILVLLLLTFGSRTLHLFEIAALALHFTAFIGILAALGVYAPRTDATFVFTDFEISSGWTNGGTAWLIGAVSSVFAFLGYDGPCHLAEESRNATTAVANAMVLGMFTNGIMGIAILIVFLYNISNLADTLSQTGYDFVYVFMQTTGSTASATAISSFIAFFGFAACLAVSAGGSRVIWAFARDNGIPFSSFFTKLHQPAAYPLRAIILYVAVALILSLIQIGSTQAFNAFISISISGIQIANIIPITLFIIRKINGTAPKGPWSLGVVFGLPINIFAVIFLVITTIYSFFPTMLPVTAANMNWSCVVFGAATIVGLIYYAVWGREIFNGPVQEVGANGPAQANA